MRLFLVTRCYKNFCSWIHLITISIELKMKCIALEIEENYSKDLSITSIILYFRVGESVSSWRFPIWELRKLHPLCRTATLWGVGWELWLQSRNGTSTSHLTMIYDKLLRRLVESVKRLTSGVQGQIGAYEICTRARVARLAECCLKQKMGYGRDTNPQGLKPNLSIRSK